MFELLPASPMNAVLPVETAQPSLHHFGDPDYPPKKLAVTSIDVLSSVEIGDPTLPPKKLAVAGIDVLSSVDFGDVTLPPKK